jgi:hypothetical protein
MLGSPAEFGPWRMKEQTFGRWSRRSVWKRVLERAQAWGTVELSLAFLDGTQHPLHQKAAGATREGDFSRAG